MVGNDKSMVLEMAIVTLISETCDLKGTEKMSFIDFYERYFEEIHQGFEMGHVSSERMQAIKSAFVNMLKDEQPYSPVAVFYNMKDEDYEHTLLVYILSIFNNTLPPEPLKKNLTMYYGAAFLLLVAGGALWYRRNV